MHVKQVVRVVVSVLTKLTGIYRTLHVKQVVRVVVSYF
eukprot:COSAG05_NODE_14391_length_398_cov_0.692308_2_plen_38_part_01